MDGTGWVETQAAHQLRPVELHLYNAPAAHHPNTLNVINRYPQPLPQTLPFPSSSTSYYYYTNANPNHNPSPSQEAYVSAAAGAADSYVTNPYAPHGGYENLGAVAYSYSPPPAEGGIGLTYYYDMGGGDMHSLAAKEAIRQYGVEPFAYAPAATRPSNEIGSTLPTHKILQHWNQHSTHPTLKSARRKGFKKNTKVVQPAYCNVCKVDCNSPDVLKSHKQGKKHKKNLQKLHEFVTAKPMKPPTETTNKQKILLPDKGKTVDEQSNKKGAAATPEDLKAKRQRVLEGGAAAEEVKVCNICNVVVNNQKVFEFHIAGQKHAAMLKRQQELRATKEPQAA
ncbi:uncharacterized protein [Typha angustifolia]|uniref:uncharacterized protein n=1 Tax=Typha angustifolia TaxID=59011 RepID=UPI003C30093E